jgi:uncharacterized protein YhbP (UPF0306 family)
VKGLRPRLLAFLRAHRVLTLAVTAEGAPHAAAVFYAVDSQLRFYFVTDPATRHGTALLSGGMVAGTIQRDEQQWHEVQGVQFRGPCRQLAGAARKRAWALYVTRFPFVMSRDVPLTGALMKTALWCLEPDWIRLIDNRLGFGHKEEWRRHPRLKHEGGAGVQ